MFWKGICCELLWFIHGKTDSKLLEAMDVNIWKDNSSREFLDSVGLHNYNIGDIGPMYGFQWRHFNGLYKGCDYNYDGEGYDQLQDCIDLIPQMMFYYTGEKDDSIYKFGKKLFKKDLTPIIYEIDNSSNFIDKLYLDINYDKKGYYILNNIQPSNLKKNNNQLCN